MAADINGSDSFDLEQQEWLEAMDDVHRMPVSYTHLTLPTNREV